MKNYTALLFAAFVMAGSHSIAQNSYHIQLPNVENGSFNVSPDVPEDGQVEAGTRLKISASPNKGYALDVMYSRYKGGMWGYLNEEFFNPEATITVDKDMELGAVFVPKSKVGHLNIIRDVVYAQPGVKPLKYDVYTPKGAKNLPCIVIVHGGGWSSNNEDVMRGLAWELARKAEFVVVSIDYRWINQGDGDVQPNLMHHLIEDVFGAVAHIREHAEEYGIDPKRIGLTGDSAGGHLSASGALLTTQISAGFTPTFIPEGQTAAEVKEALTESIKAVAPSYGPVHAKDFKMFLHDTSAAYLKTVSPAEFVPDAALREVPHFIVRGTLDPLIPASMVDDYVSILQAHGQYVEYYHIEGASHAFFDWKPDAATRNTFEEIGVPYADKMRQFFLKYL